jgi:hypothetical protein
MPSRSRTLPRVPPRNLAPPVTSLDGMGKPRHSPAHSCQISRNNPKSPLAQTPKPPEFASPTPRIELNYQITSTHRENHGMGRNKSAETAGRDESGEGSASYQRRRGQSGCDGGGVGSCPMIGARARGILGKAKKARGGGADG